MISAHSHNTIHNSFFIMKIHYEWIFAPTMQFIVHNSSSLFILFWKEIIFTQASFFCWFYKFSVIFQRWWKEKIRILWRLLKPSKQSLLFGTNPTATTVTKSRLQMHGRTLLAVADMTVLFYWRFSAPNLDGPAAKKKWEGLKRARCNAKKPKKVEVEQANCAP